MKVKELTKVIFDKVIIYKAGDEFGEYKDIFKGEKSKIPGDILDMEVEIIGAKRKDILDIEVRN